MFRFHLADVLDLALHAVTARRHVNQSDLGLTGPALVVVAEQRTAYLTSNGLPQLPPSPDQPPHDRVRIVYPDNVGPSQPRHDSNSDGDGDGRVIALPLRQTAGGQQLVEELYIAASRGSNVLAVTISGDTLTLAALRVPPAPGRRTPAEPPRRPDNAVSDRSLRRRSATGSPAGSGDVAPWAGRTSQSRPTDGHVRPPRPAPSEKGNPPMLHITICPVCGEPVAEDSSRHAAGPGRGADRYPWLHLADNTPICFNEDGKRSYAVITEELLPVDDDAHAWLAMISDLFASDGLYSPGRLGTAINAAEHLHHWLYRASGPFGATMAMPTPGEVALLVGHLYRTSRLFARIHTQAGTRLTRMVRDQKSVDIGDDDVRGAWAVVRGQAHDSRELLDAAAETATGSADYSGAAWACVRRAALAWTVAVPKRLPDGLTVVDQADYPPGDETVADAGSGQELPGGLTHDQLGELLGVAFGDDAAFSPELTGIAARATGTLVTYLARCLGVAGSAAIATPSDAASLATSLTYLSATLADGLHRFTQRRPGGDGDVLDGTDAAAIRASLDKAVEGLHLAAHHLAAVSYLAAGLPLPNDQQ
ncbi:hypothetical protein ACFQ3X_30800 [Plantactinospora endophytica]